MPVHHSPHKKTLLGVWGGAERGVPHESGLEMLIRANDRWPSGTLTAAPFFYVTWLNGMRLLTRTTGSDGNLCWHRRTTHRRALCHDGVGNLRPPPPGHARLRLWKCSLPTMRAQSCADARLSEIGMISPAMAQQLAHENMLRIINWESI